MTSKEQRFLDALADLFVGAEIEGDSGYINLMRIKSRYYREGVLPHLMADIDAAVAPFPTFREELFDKLYTFFSRYFSENGSLYFCHTPPHQSVYEKVYTDDQDVMLFWKTHMLYYVKTDRLFHNMDVEVDGRRFAFDVSTLEHKRANEKRALIYDYRERRQDGALVFAVAYTEKGRKTKVDDIRRALKHEGVEVTEETLERAFRLFERQSEVDYFINKDAGAFLREQFDLWMYQYVFAGQGQWTEARIRQLQVLKEIALKIISFIAQFEDELVRIWNKPKFVLHSHYVITLDRIAARDMALLDRVLAHPGMGAQTQEWRDLGMVTDAFAPEMVWRQDETGRRLHERYQHLPLDTKHTPGLELEIIGLFDHLDQTLDGWLIHSENYQALITLSDKLKGRVRTIYIDPPYNASTSEIPYVNRMKHATWLTMMSNRLVASLPIAAPESVYVIAVDDIEQKLLGSVLEQGALSNRSVVCVTVVHNRRGQQGNNFSTVHEYAYFCLPDDKGKYIADRGLEEIDHRNLRDSGSESMRTDARNCFYPIFVKEGRIVGFGEVLDSDKHPASANECIEGMVAVWPIDTDGRERKWRYSRAGVEGIQQDLQAIETAHGVQVYYNKRHGTARTVWDDPEFDASEYGTKVLQALFGNQVVEEFSYPKSLHLVEECIRAVLVSNSDDELVCDFFGGSGTTAHAVMNLNRQGNIHRRYIVVEMAGYFNSVILPRVKKAAYSDAWVAGVAGSGQSLGHFCKYYDLEQYEDTLRRAHYEDADLFHDPSKDPYSQYAFLRDAKLLDAVETDAEADAVHVDPSRLYDGIDLAETLSCVTGKWIRRITQEYVEFEPGEGEEQGERVSLVNPPWGLIKPLVWW